MTEAIENSESEELSVGAIESALMYGDFSALTEKQRLQFMQKLCTDLRIDIRRNPFQWIVLDNKLIPYAKKSCTDQLREVNKVSVQVIEQKLLNGAYVVQVRATTPDGRYDEDLGVVYVEGLSQNAYCNALKKAITQAKRRVTLSICGLGMLDETEVEQIPSARVNESSGPRRITPPPVMPTLPSTPVPVAIAAVSSGTVPSEELPEDKPSKKRASDIPRAKMPPAAAPVSLKPKS